MPGLVGAIVGAVTTAATAVSSMSIAALAQGAMIVGTGMSIVGEMTGNKTLSKIGMGIGLAGGVGSIANGMRGASMMSAGSKGILAADGIESALSAPTKGSGLKTFPAPNTSKSAPYASFDKSVANMDAVFDPQLEKNFFQRANDTLTKYNTAVNIAGGMGMAYMQGEQMQLQKDLLDKRLNFDQQLIDRVNVNNGTVLEGINPAMSTANTTRDLSAYSGILRGR